MKTYHINGYRIVANSFVEAQNKYLENTPFEKLTLNAKANLIKKAICNSGISSADFDDFCRELIENGKTIGRSEFAPFAKKAKRISPIQIWSGLPDTVNF